jgi:hypothetical protein
MANILDTEVKSVSKYPNVTELEILPVGAVIETIEDKDKNGKAYSFMVAIVDGKKYRIPATVIKQIQALHKKNNSLTKVTVTSQGEGKNTQYFVAPLM